MRDPAVEGGRGFAPKFIIADCLIPFPDENIFSRVYADQLHYSRNLLGKRADHEVGKHSRIWGYQLRDDIGWDVLVIGQ